MNPPEWQIVPDSCVDSLFLRREPTPTEGFEGVEGLGSDEAEDQ